MRGKALEIRLKYVVPDRDRHGNLRYYFQRARGKKHRLRGEPGSPEFMAAYEAAKGATPEPRAHAGTLGALVLAYYSSADFKALDQQTQRTRRGILESTLEEKIAPSKADRFKDIPLARLTPKHVRVLRDRKAATPHAANNRFKALRKLFAWAVEADHMTANPARDVKRMHAATTGHHSWTPDEVRQYEQRHPIGTKARLALALLLFTGQRRSDVVLFGRQHAKDGWLRFTQRKNVKRKPVTLSLPILPDLQAVIAASECGDLTFLVTSFGQAFTSNGFGNWFRERCDEAGLLHCSAHGLRKAGAAIAAENGATEQQLMAIFGWSDPAQAAHYTRAASQRKLAGDAMMLLTRERKVSAKTPTSDSHRKI